jgi:hypothetical protein
MFPLAEAVIEEFPPEPCTYPLRARASGETRALMVSHKTDALTKTCLTTGLAGSSRRLLTGSSAALDARLRDRDCDQDSPEQGGRGETRQDRTVSSVEASIGVSDRSRQGAIARGLLITQRLPAPLPVSVSV